MAEKQSIKIILTGGGSGGHIAPLLAVVSEIKKLHPDADLLYIGRKEDIESNFIQDAGLKSKAIYAGKIRRYFSWLNFVDLVKVAIGGIQSFFIIWQYRPNVVFAKGGFVSVPVAFASRVFKISIVAHESDVVMGLANRIVSRWAQKIACGFDPENYIDLKADKLVYTGNPVRAEFIEESAKAVKKSVIIGKRKTEGTLPLLLIIGASQGAHRINELLLPILPNLLEKMCIVHISGRGDYNWLENEKNHLNDLQQKRYYLYSFLLKELSSIIHRADVVISRAGASALSELAIFKKVSIIIPLSTSASNHQWHNAKIFERAEAIKLVDERKASPRDLQNLIIDLLKDKKLQSSLSTNINQFASPNAAQKIAELIINEVNFKNHETFKFKT